MEEILSTIQRSAEIHSMLFYTLENKVSICLKLSVDRLSINFNKAQVRVTHAELSLMQMRMKNLNFLAKIFTMPVKFIRALVHLGQRNFLHLICMWQAIESGSNYKLQYSIYFILDQDSFAPIERKRIHLDPHFFPLVLIVPLTVPLVSCDWALKFGGGITGRLPKFRVSTGVGWLAFMGGLNWLGFADGIFDGWIGGLEFKPPFAWVFLCAFAAIAASYEK